MKRAFLAILCALVCIVTPAPSKATTVSLNWTYDFVSNPPCSATVVKSCVTGFEYGTTVDAGKTLVKLGQFGNAGLIQNITQAFPFGPTVFYIRAIAVDASGATVFSTPQLAPSVNITASPVKTFTVTITAN